MYRNVHVNSDCEDIKMLTDVLHSNGSKERIDLSLGSLSSSLSADEKYHFTH